MYFDTCRYNADTNSYTIRVARSKRDRYNLGTDVHLLPTGGDFCPVNLLTEYLKQRPTTAPHTPLFVYPDGRYLTRRHIAHALKTAAPIVHIDPDTISTHSLRIGGAFALAEDDVPWMDIVARANWAPSTAAEMLLKYTRMSLKRGSRMAKALKIYSTRHENHSIPLTSLRPKPARARLAASLAMF